MCSSDLYEMLLGKVPFEGSSMAEVLMKHLTSQPALDQLPHPFGKVVRKALEKDPKDRYQTVEEMVEELLAGEEIQKSLAGFSPQSLSGAVRYGARDGAESPVPSPNPTPRAGVGSAVRTGRVVFNVEAGLPDKFARRMERISKKIDAKMGKLAGRRPGSPQRAGVGPQATLEPKKRMLLSLVFLVGMSVGLGVVFGNVVQDDVGASAGMLAAAMSGGVLLARRATRWFGIEDGPVWSARLIQACCSAPLLAIGAAPMLDSGEHHEAGLAVFLGLLAVSVFANWDKLWHSEHVGEMSVGSALGKALGAVVATMLAWLITITDTEPDRFVVMAACVAGVTSLVLQSTAWHSAPQAAPDGDPTRPVRPSNLAPVAHTAAVVVPPPPPPVGSPPEWAIEDSAYAAAEPGSAHPARRKDGPRARWAVSRAFWGFVSFGLMGGAIVTFLVPLIATPSNPHEITLAIILCCGFASFMLFALRKTGPVKRPGFWRETLRPFLISVSLFGIGGTTTGIAREWNCTYGSPEECESEIEDFEKKLVDSDAPFAVAERKAQLGLFDAAIQVAECRSVAFETKGPFREAREQILNHAHRLNLGLTGQDWRLQHRCVSDEGRVALVSGLVFSSLSFLFLTFFTGGAPRPTKPFLQTGEVDAGDPEACPLKVRPHRGTLVLVLGILGAVTFLLPFGIVAWVMGEHDLTEMRAGRMDAEGMGMTKAGKVCGMVNVLATVTVTFIIFVSVFFLVMPGR